MKRVIILLGTTILLVGSIVSLPVSTGAQEPTADPVADDKLVDRDPFADANFANQNGINDTINTPESRENARLNDRVQDRDTFIASLLPGQKSPTPCVRPKAMKWAVDGLRAKKALFFGIYCEVANPHYKALQAEMLKERVLEQIAVGLNRSFTITRPVTFTYLECNQANAYYLPQRSRVVMCYELVDEFYKTFQKDGLKGDELDQSVENAVTFAFYHELGHALVGVLDLPITGKEEDAVDQLATFIVADGADADETTALDGAIAFLLMAKNAKGQHTPFWDQHSLGEQRFYSIICSLYGDSPDKYASVVTEGLLPKTRAAQCIPEWKRIERSWTRLLAPYVKKK